MKGACQRRQEVAFKVCTPQFYVCRRSERFHPSLNSRTAQESTTAKNLCETSAAVAGHVEYRTTQDRKRGIPPTRQWRGKNVACGLGRTGPAPRRTGGTPLPEVASIWAIPKTEALAGVVGEVQKGMQAGPAASKERQPGRRAAVGLGFEIFRVEARRRPTWTSWSGAPSLGAGR